MLHLLNQWILLWNFKDTVNITFLMFTTFNIDKLIVYC